MTALRRIINWKRPQPAPKYMAKMLNANFPQITETGIYNDRNIAGTNRKSPHAEGRALDIHLDANSPGQRILADELFKSLIRKAYSLGIDNTIWNRKIWSRAHGGPRPYTGENPHTDHIHVEFNRAGSQKSVLPELDLEIAIIRTGLEDLDKGRDNIA